MMVCRAVMKSQPKVLGVEGGKETSKEEVRKKPHVYLVTNVCVEPTAQTQANSHTTINNTAKFPQQRAPENESILNTRRHAFEKG